MSVILRVIGGPALGREHVFDHHDTVVVGRQGAHLDLCQHRAGRQQARGCE